MASGDELRQQILELIPAYHDAAFPRQAFVPGQTPVPVSGRVFDADDVAHLIDAGLDFWLTTGRFAEQFEREFARTIGVRNAVLCTRPSPSTTPASTLVPPMSTPTTTGAVSAVTAPRATRRRR